MVEVEKTISLLQEDLFDRWLQSLREDDFCGTYELCPIELYLWSEGINPRQVSGIREFSITKDGRIIFNIPDPTDDNHLLTFHLGGRLGTLPRIVDNYLLNKHDNPKYIDWGVLEVEELSRCWLETKDQLPVTNNCEVD